MIEPRMTEIANVDMAAAWDGEEGDDWSENAERYDAADREIWARFEGEVDIGEADQVLDIGCGTGKSTRSAARRASSGSVLGIDLSSRMLDRARRQSEDEGLTNIRYVQGDAQVHPFEPEVFDIAISSFGAMFFADPVAAFTNLARALRHDGRVAFVAWQRFENNEWLTEIFDAVAAGHELPAPARIAGPIWTRRPRRRDSDPAPRRVRRRANHASDRTGLAGLRRRRLLVLRVQHGGRPWTHRRP